MAEFLITRGVSHYIEDVIRDAKDWLFIICPYLKISDTLFDRLKDADRKNVKTTLVFGGNGLGVYERRQLRQLKNLTVYFLKNLHAKYYFNEQNMVITSMNIYEYSEVNNREIGILVSKSSDTKLFVDALREASSIVGSANKLYSVINAEELLSRIIGETKIPVASEQTFGIELKGFCIVCQAHTRYDLDIPLCNSHHQQFIKLGYSDCEGTYCHTCGTSFQTSKSRPECPSCYHRGVRNVIIARFTRGLS